MPDTRFRDWGIEGLRNLRICDMGFRIAARPGANLRITLQHCLQAKTRQIAHYNVNGLGQGLRN